MIRITNLNEKFTPISNKGGSITIAFDYEAVYDVDNNGNKVETNIGTWSVHTFVKVPSFGQLKDFILSEINNRVDEKILSGYVWRDMPVWLSSENQFNYKAAYDLAVMSEGKSLPVVFKFGTSEKPVYHQFTELAELNDFYIGAMNHINNCLQEGWRKKDNIDWREYEETLNKLN